MADQFEARISFKALLMDICTHVPPLFVMDSILKLTFPLPWDWASDSEDYRDIIHISFARVTITAFTLFICFVAALIVFVQQTKHLFAVYKYVGSLSLVYFAYNVNKSFIEKIAQKEGEGIHIFEDNMGLIIKQFSLQLMLAWTYCTIRIDGFNSKWVISGSDKIIYISTQQPLIWTLLGVPESWRKLSLYFAQTTLVSDALAHTVAHLATLLPKARLISKKIWMDLKIYGAQQVIEHNWKRLHIPTMLRVFWLLRMTYFLGLLLLHRIEVKQGEIDMDDEPEETVSINSLTLEDLHQVCSSLLVIGCETLMAVLGMTSIVSYIAHYLGLVLATFVGSKSEEDKNMGIVSAILFFILALQTGLTSLEPDARLERLYRNFCLLFTAILHFVHGMINPLLMTLSASHSSSFSKHLRVLGMCAFLIVFPCFFMFHLWQVHHISTWLLAVTAFSIEVIIKVFISLMVYTLFMIDSQREDYWTNLDDYVYYIKSTGSTIEFMFGIFLFCNGAWIMFFESGGGIRAIMMCVHAYFNIFLQAKEGWKVFMKRRTAVQKINSLKSATKELLAKHDDVCAICYQVFDTSSKVTQCGHIFHGVCLRKWLYVQDTCPLCHTTIYKPPPEREVDNHAIPDNVARNHLFVDNNRQVDNNVARNHLFVDNNQQVDNNVARNQLFVDNNRQVDNNVHNHAIPDNVAGNNLIVDNDWRVQEEIPLEEEL